ncbi:hypothetical protein [Alteromonas sp. KUL106]|uniref:hypothetical protein n=1 Tax=Alteromonas sp. KUL106 TaxID=2480799 RepID=UPI0012E647E4|nr:hypothetical protein [Alteromonas sp. KUL106]GFD70119.1 hypothetical protein KUL106_33820 [Alteromonas sp. KUL106]
MPKVCVFCGEKPDGKSKEHVVPRWLIELTGDPKREALLGYKKDPESGYEERRFSFDQFTFPACLKCNNKYASLERDAKGILEKILNEESVTTEQASLFLDWLDKVRVGLWLGMIQLDKTYDLIAPNFHIESRIAQYDRMLIVEKTDAQTRKLNMVGVDTYSFSLTPSAFVLVVNNYYITNVSYMYLFHRRLGFPYPSELFLRAEDDCVEARFSAGRNRIMVPLLRKAIRERGIILYQPMFKSGLTLSEKVDYGNDYVRRHSLNFSEGVGNIFLESDGQLIEKTSGEEFRLSPSEIQQDTELFFISGINVCEWQNWLVSLLAKSDKLKPEQRKYIKSRFNLGIKINEQFIQNHKALLKKYTT